MILKVKIKVVKMTMMVMSRELHQRNGILPFFFLRLKLVYNRSHSNQYSFLSPSSAVCSSVYVCILSSVKVKVAIAGKVPYKIILKIHVRLPKVKTK